MQIVGKKEFLKLKEQTEKEERTQSCGTSSEQTARAGQI